MGFSTDPAQVRIDQFWPNGTWYATLALGMGKYYEWGTEPQASLKVYDEVLLPVAGAVKLAIFDLLRETAVPLAGDPYLCAVFDRWTWVCLEPYHVNAHPVLFPAQSEGV